MESNWRYNVWALGMTASDWEMAAGLAPPFLANLYIVKLSATTRRIFQKPVAPGQIPVPVSPLTLIPPGRPFTWGFPVFPD